MFPLHPRITNGVTYDNAYAPGLTDSVPGLAALVTGGSPLSTGLFYDDIYDRTLYAGTDANCTGPQGVEVFLQEVVGIDAFNGGALSHLDGGGDFNPQQIPHRKVGSHCVPVYPHDFIKTNTIFDGREGAHPRQPYRLVRQACMGYRPTRLGPRLAPSRRSPCSSRTRRTRLSAPSSGRPTERSIVAWLMCLPAAMEATTDRARRPAFKARATSGPAMRFRRRCARRGDPV